MMVYRLLRNKLNLQGLAADKTSMVNRNAFDLKTNCVLRLIASEQQNAKLKADYLQLKIDSVRYKVHNVKDD